MDANGLVDLICLRVDKLYTVSHALPVVVSSYHTAWELKLLCCYCTRSGSPP